MYLEQIKHCFIPYSWPSVTAHGSQAALLLAQLESCHIRPMGATSGPGLLTGVEVHPVPEGCILPTEQPTPTSSGRGSAEAVDQRSHKEGGAVSRAVCQQALFNSQEGWILPTSSEPEAIKSVHGQGALQNGRDQHVEGSPVGERLDGLHRSERCIPLSGSEDRTQEVPPFCLGRTDIRVPVPAIRIEQCTEGIHQAPEASGGSPQASRNLPCDFLG